MLSYRGYPESVKSNTSDMTRLPRVGEIVFEVGYNNLSVRHYDTGMVELWEDLTKTLVGSPLKDGLYKASCYAVPTTGWESGNVQDWEVVWELREEPLIGPQANPTDKGCTGSLFP